MSCPHCFLQLPQRMTLTDHKEPKCQVRREAHSAIRRTRTLVSPGGGKWWRRKYRFRGREKRLSLGVYLDVTAEGGPRTDVTPPESC